MTTRKYEHGGFTMRTQTVKFQKTGFHFKLE